MYFKTFELGQLGVITSVFLLSKFLDNLEMLLKGQIQGSVHLDEKKF